MATYTAADFADVPAEGDDDNYDPLTNLSTDDDADNNEPVVDPEPVPEPTAPRPSVLDTVLEGDDVPEDLRGKPMKDVLAAMNTMRQMTKALMDRQAQPTAPAPVAESEPESLFTEDDVGVGVDPNGFQSKLEQFFEKKAQPFVISMYQQQSVAAMEAASKQLPYFERFKDQIMAYAAQLTVDKTAQPQTWQLIHSHVVAQNMDTIIKEKAAEAANNTQRRTPQFSESGSNVPAAPSRTVKLTDEERLAARLLGVSEAAYAQFRK